MRSLLFGLLPVAILGGCVGPLFPPTSNPERVVLPLADGGDGQSLTLSVRSCVYLEPTVYFPRSVLERSRIPIEINATNKSFMPPLRVVFTIDREHSGLERDVVKNWRSLDLSADQPGSWRAGEVGFVFGKLVMPRGNYTIQATVPVPASDLQGMPAQLELSFNTKFLPSSDECTRAANRDA